MANENLIDIIFAKNKTVSQVKTEHDDAIIFGNDGSLNVKSKNNFDKEIIPAGAQFTDTTYSEEDIVNLFLKGAQGHQGIQGFQGVNGNTGVQGVQGTQGATGDIGDKDNWR